MTFSEFERVLNHCPHITNFWLFLRVVEFCLFVLLTSTIKNIKPPKGRLLFFMVEMKPEKAFASYNEGVLNGTQYRFIRHQVCFIKRLFR